jgi:hypothetical protein
MKTDLCRTASMRECISTIHGNADTFKSAQTSKTRFSQCPFGSHLPTLRCFFNPSYGPAEVKW